MLLKFTISNHLSFRDRVEISLVASSLKDNSAGLISSDALGPGMSILPAAIVYGPNAAGKSNVIAALRRMSSIVIGSHAGAGPDDLIPYTPFALDAEYSSAPTEFSIDFVKDGIRFNYLFSFDANSIHMETLYSFPFGRPQLLFERDGRSFRFGRKLKGRNHVIGELTRGNSLFLSAAAQNDHDDLTPIYRYFSEMIFSTDVSVSGSGSATSPDEIDKRAIAFLNIMGTGVVDYRLIEDSSDEQRAKFTADLRSLLVRHFNVSENIDLVGDHYVLQLGHQKSDGSIAYLEFARESAGTRRLVFLLTEIFRVLDRGGLILVDELDASLHTQAFEFVLALFCTPENNPHGAQLVATVHDTNILASDVIRRDQVWFAQKANNGVTELYSLADMKIRGSDNFEKGYLQGRFGAVPSTTGLESLLSKIRMVQ